jgi:hypothetical protein
VAAETQGCVSPFSNFANSALDLIFTADFGIVGEFVLFSLYPLSAVFCSLNYSLSPIDMIVAAVGGGER